MQQPDRDRSSSSEPTASLLKNSLIAQSSNATNGKLLPHQTDIKGIQQNQTVSVEEKNKYKFFDNNKNTGINSNVSNISNPNHNNIHNIAYQGNKNSNSNLNLQSNTITNNSGVNFHIYPGPGNTNTGGTSNNLPNHSSSSNTISIQDNRDRLSNTSTGQSGTGQSGSSYSNTFDQNNHVFSRITNSTLNSTLSPHSASQKSSKNSNLCFTPEFLSNKCTQFLNMTCWLIQVPLRKVKAYSKLLLLLIIVYFIFSKADYIENLELANIDVGIRKYDGPIILNTPYNNSLYQTASNLHGLYGVGNDKFCPTNTKPRLYFLKTHKTGSSTLQAIFFRKAYHTNSTVMFPKNDGKHVFQYPTPFNPTMMDEVCREQIKGVGFVSTGP